MGHAGAEQSAASGGRSRRSRHRRRAGSSPPTRRSTRPANRQRHDSRRRCWSVRWPRSPPCHHECPGSKPSMTSGQARSRWISTPVGERSNGCWPHGCRQTGCNRGTSDLDLQPALRGRDRSADALEPVGRILPTPSAPCSDLAVGTRRLGWARRVAGARHPRRLRSNCAVVEASASTERASSAARRGATRRRARRHRSDRSHVAERCSQPIGQAPLLRLPVTSSIGRCRHPPQSVASVPRSPRRGNCRHHRTAGRPSLAPERRWEVGQLDDTRKYRGNDSAALLRSAEGACRARRDRTSC